MRIRLGRLEDAEGITLTHCSDVNEWYHRENGKKTMRASYEELTILERYLHGGPWMSIESCAVHLNSLLLEDHPIIVAEVDGKIAGEAELLINEEPVSGELHRIAHLDVIQVHKDFRKQGIGRALMRFSEEIARERGCDMLTVTPEERALAFYKKLGVNKIIQHGVMMDFNLEEFPHKDVKIQRGEFPWSKIRDKEMILGKFQSSYHHWFMAFKERISGIDDGLYFESGRFGDSYYVIESSFFGNDIATVYSWGDNFVETLMILGSRAKELGFKKLRTLVKEQDTEVTRPLKPSITGKSIILAKKL